MKVSNELKLKGKGLRRCRICGSSRAVIRSYGLYICKRCFREHAKELGFEQYQ